MNAMSNRNLQVVALISAVLSLASGPVMGQPRVALKSHCERVEVEGRVAVTTVQQTYVNYTNRNQEITLRFHLPPGGAVSELTMWVEGLRSPGVFHPRVAARRIYREIRNADRDPALLEYLGSDTWRLSVFPILPKETQKVEFKFTSILGGTDGDCVYRSMKVIGGSFKQALDFELSASLRYPGGIEDVKAVSDKLGVQRVKDGIELGFRVENRELGNETAFAFTPKARPANVMQFRSPDGGKYYAAVLDPSWDAPQPKPVGRNVAIVLDASASMKGRLFQGAATAVKTILNDLTDKDKFAVVVAGSDVGLSSEKLQPASKGAKAKAIKWLTGFMPKGGTDLAGAMRAVESLSKQTGKTLNVFMLSDSNDCVGARSPAKELSPFLSDKEKLPARPPSNCRFFILMDYSESYILGFLAESTGGSMDYIDYDNPKNIARAVRSMLAQTRIPDPVTKVTIKQIIRGQAKGAKPRADLVDIGLSRPDPAGGMVITGRWPGPGKRTIEVTQQRLDGTQSTRYVLDFPKDSDISPQAPGLRKVWAHQRADGMWAKLHREDVKLGEVRAFMTFSRAESIVTRGMALIVLESDEDYIERGIKRPGSSVTVKKSLVQLTPEDLIKGIVTAPRPEWERFDTLDPEKARLAVKRAQDLLRRGKIAAAAKVFEEAASSRPGQFEARRQASEIGEYLAMKKSYTVDQMVRKSHDQVLQAVLKGAPWHELLMQTEPTGLVLRDPNEDRPTVTIDSKSEILARGAQNGPQSTAPPEERILSRPIPDINMKNAALKDVLARLKPGKEDLEVRWDKLAVDGIKPSTTINLVMTDATLGQALGSVMKKLASVARSEKGQKQKPDFIVDKSGITISSRKDIGVNVHARMYDIRDLLAYAIDQDRTTREINAGPDRWTVARGSIRRGVPDDVFAVYVGDNSSGNTTTSISIASGSFSTSGDEPTLFELDDDPNDRGRWSERSDDSSGLFDTGLFDPGAGEGSGLEGEYRSVDERTSEIRRLLTETVDRDSWRNAGGEAGSISEVHGVLTILQTRDNHKEIAKVLDNLRNTWRKRSSIRIASIGQNGQSVRLQEEPEDPFNAKGRINQWVLDLLKRAEAGKLSKFSSVKVEKIGTRTFAMVCGVWFDTSLAASCRISSVVPDSAAHTALLKADPRIEKYLALGKYVIVRADAASAIYLNTDGISDPKDKDMKKVIAALTKRPAK